MKTVNKISVVFLKDAAGVPEGTIKSLPERIAKPLIAKGTAALEGEVKTKDQPKAKVKKR
jgi:hypothetical protein